MGASAPERATAVNFRRRRATRAAAPPQPTEQSGHAREHGFMSAADIAVALVDGARSERGAASRIRDQELPGLSKGA